MIAVLYISEFIQIIPKYNVGLTGVAQGTDVDLHGAGLLGCV